MISVSGSRSWSWSLAMSLSWSWSFAMSLSWAVSEGSASGVCGDAGRGGEAGENAIGDRGGEEDGEEEFEEEDEDEDEDEPKISIISWLIVLDDLAASSGLDATVLDIKAVGL